MNNSKSGFTLIELLVVVGIISLLASILTASLSSARMRGRNAKRMVEIHTVEVALEQYYNANGRYPTGDGDGCGGWDVGNQTLPFLNGRLTGILDNPPSDTTKTGNCDGYFYYRYPAGSSGCPASWGAFYVLATYTEPNNTNPNMVLPAPCSNSWSGFGYGKYKFESQ